MALPKGAGITMMIFSDLYFFSCTSLKYCTHCIALWNVWSVNKRNFQTWCCLQCGIFLKKESRIDGKFCTGSWDSAGEYRVRLVLTQVSLSYQGDELFLFRADVTLSAAHRFKCHLEKNTEKIKRKEKQVRRDIVCQHAVDTWPVVCYSQRHDSCCFCC